MIRILLLLIVLPLATAFSQQTTPSQPGPKPDIKVKAAKPEYRAQAKITAQVAIDSALARVPGGRVREAELEKEHGRLVYSFDIQVPQQQGEQEVQIDAGSGKVVSVEHESAKAEAKEHAHEHQHARSEIAKEQPHSY